MTAGLSHGQILTAAPKSDCKQGHKAAHWHPGGGLGPKPHLTVEKPTSKAVTLNSSFLRPLNRAAVNHVKDLVAWATTPEYASPLTLKIRVGSLSRHKARRTKEKIVFLTHLPALTYFNPSPSPLEKWSKSAEVKHLTQRGITAERKQRLVRG